MFGARKKSKIAEREKKKMDGRRGKGRREMWIYIASARVSERRGEVVK